MVDTDDGEEHFSRPPVLADLLNICRELNRLGARYVVIGGMAIIQAGFLRATEDIDLLVDASPENFALVRQALTVLPDKAVTEVRPSDLDDYIVVRVADEVVVDLLKSACGVEYASAKGSIDFVDIEGVAIPFANTELLLRLKQTVRDKDRIDREFLEMKLRSG